MPTLFLAAAILVVFFAVDWTLCRKERHLTPSTTGRAPLQLEGLPNFVLLAAVIGAVLLSGLWQSGMTFTVLGTPLELAGRKGALAALIDLLGDGAGNPTSATRRIS
jgi:Na+/H+ antiporter NhaD/arsenite permease-like protein